MRDDDRHKEVTVVLHTDQRAVGSDPTGGLDGHPVVAACGEPCGLASGIDAAHLHRHRGDTRQAQHEHDDQRRDAQRRLDGAGAGVTA